MNKLQSIIETPLAGILGQTLLHSIWQGVLIVSAYLVIQRLHTKSDQKVWLGLGAFLAQTAGSLLTFFYLLPEKPELANSDAVSPDITFTFSNLLKTEVTQSYFERIQANSHWIFAGWLIGFSFLIIRQLGGLAYLHYLKQAGTSKLNTKAEGALKRVMEKLGTYTPSFDAKMSLKVSTAMVLGHIKPVMLLPAALVTGLSNEQLELIIAHEIAHIKRSDFLINLIQTLAENLFFYHPAYWLVSYQIRENREHACDEFAASLTGNRILLAETLAQLQLSRTTPSLAMAFGKQKMPVLARIERLLGVTPKNHTSRFTAFILMLSGIVALSFTQDNNAQKTSVSISDPIIREVSDLAIMENIIPEISMLPDTGRQREHIYMGFGDDDIQMRNQNYDVKINEDGILVNGVAQELTDAQRKNLRKHFSAIKEASADLDIRTKDIQIESEKMQKIHEDIQARFPGNPDEDPEFQKSLKGIEEMGKEIQKYAMIYQEEVQKLNFKDADYEKKMDELSREFEANMKSYEENMQVLEKNMEGFSEKMKEYELVIEQELEVPISKLQAVVEKQEVYIQEAAQKIEVNHEAILQMLPAEVRESFGDVPKPVKPPKPPKPAKPAKISPLPPAKTPPVPPKPGR